MIRSGSKLRTDFFDRRLQSGNPTRSRASSVDCRSRGSYVPTQARSSSLDRPRSFGSGARISYSRGSSTLAPDGKRVIKDNRPLHDKAYQKKRVEELVEYLKQNGYTFFRAISCPPSKKEYESIFQFLYFYWDNSYKVVKLEEEAPRILKNLGYPFTPNKSVFMCMTSQNWPVLLGILTWLMDINKYFMNLEDYVHFIDDRDSKESSILFKYMCQEYKNGGQTDQEKEEEIFTNLLLSRNEYNIEQLEYQHQECKKEQEELNLELKRFNELKAKDSDFQTRKKQYEEFFGKMESHIANRKKVVQQIQDEYKEKEAELMVLESKLKEKQALYDAQGYDGQMQLNYIASQKKELNAKLDDKCNELKHSQAELWETEVQFTQLADKGVADVEQFNEMYSHIQQTCENAVAAVQELPLPKVKAMFKNLNAELHLPEFKMCPNPLSYNTWVNTVFPLVVEAKKKLDSSGNVLKSISASQSKKLHEVQLKKSELLSTQKLAQAQLTQKEHELNSKEQQVEEEIRTMQLECEEYLQSLKKVQNQKLECIQKKKKLLANQLELENSIAAQEKETLEYVEESKLMFAALESMKQDILNQKQECENHILASLGKLKD